MPYTTYARGISHRFQDFIKELSSDLAARGIDVSKITQSANEASMDVKKTDESGSLRLSIHGNDIEAIYTTSGGVDDTFREALRGASGKRGGADVLSGILTGALRGLEKDRSEATRFARELSEAVQEAEERVLQILEMEREMLEKPPTFVEDVSFKCECGHVFTYEAIRNVVSGGLIKCPYCRKVYKKR